MEGCSRGKRNVWRRGGVAAVLWSFILWSGGGGAAAQAADAQWTTPSGDLQGTRYSSLAQINSGNVSRLVEEFSVATETKRNHEGQPLVVGSTMYVVTPWPNKLIALDLHTPGHVLWTFNPGTSEYAKGVACCDVVNRGAAYANGKIIYSLLDDTVVAVDAKTGAQVWRTRLGRPQTGETMPGAPLIVKDKVIVGNAGGELGIRGWVQALDVNTGKPLWKAYNTGPDADVKIGPKFKAFYKKDQGKDLGSTSWPGTLWKQGGGTVWNWFTYDPDLNLVYYGTANPGVWNPDMRPGDNKWGATIFARNPDTGEAMWAYQVTPHDGWDFDSISESTVVSLDIPDNKGNKKTRKVLVHFDKNGFAYTLDAATGEVLVANKFAADVTWASGIDLTTGEPAVNFGMDTHEGKTTTNICPSPMGGKEYTPAAFSPQTNLFYVPGINYCWDFEPLRALYIQGTPFMGANFKLFAPGAGGFGGEFIAWDPATGAKKWSIQEKFPLYSGVLATAGNVVFYGTLDRWFKAVDANTGAVLFKKQLECGVAGNPMTYTAPDGKQRVAVYTGTGTLTGFDGGPCPADSGDDEHHQTTSGPTSGAVHVFKLP